MEATDPAKAPAGDDSPPPPAAKRDLRFCLLLAAILGGLYGACQNGQWTPGGGDDAFYLAVARNLRTGEGYFFDQAPVTPTPPGWPAVLAAAMCLSPSFTFLNLLLMACCLAAACLWYLLLRQFASPGRAFLATLLTGVLFEWHRFSYTHYTEALFYLLVAAALTAALPAARRGGAWRIGLVAVLAGATILVRLAGVLVVVVVAALLLHGEVRPRWNRRWAAAALVAVVGAATFAATLHGLRRHADAAAADAANPIQQERAASALQDDAQFARSVYGQGAMLYLRRFRQGGEWMCRLLWPPAAMTTRWPVLRWPVNLFGWGLVVLLAACVPAAVRKRQWIWPAALAYCLAFFALWGQPVPRYLGPIAPLLVLGLWQGLQAIGRAVARPWAPPLAAGGAAVLLGSAGVCNLAILTVNAYVARSSNYHDLCLAGEYAEVIRIGKYLRGDSSPPGPVGLYVRYRDPIRSKDSSWMHRAIVLLSQRGVRRIPPVLGGRADAQALADWARSEGVGVVVLRPRRLESRLWHLRLTPGGSGENPSGPFYVLYQLKNDQLAQVDLPEITGGLRRVPGL